MEIHCSIQTRLQALTISLLLLLLLCNVVRPGRIDLKSAIIANTLRSLSTRDFFDIECKGVYDKSILNKLERICIDCYNLYQEPQLLILCK